MRGILVFTQSGDASTSKKTCCSFHTAGTSNARRRTSEGWRLRGAASLARQSRPQPFQGTAMASRGYCWGCHLHLPPKAVGYEQGSGRNGEANCEGEECVPGGPGSEGYRAKASPARREAKRRRAQRRGDAHNEGAARTTNGRTAKRFLGPLRRRCEDPQ